MDQPILSRMKHIPVVFKSGRPTRLLAHVRGE
jgi:hypothetical protein